jgi:hypothetical protein
MAENVIFRKVSQDTAHTSVVAKSTIMSFIFMHIPLMLLK